MFVRNILLRQSDVICFHNILFNRFKNNRSISTHYYELLENRQANILLLLVPCCILIILYSDTFTDFNLAHSFSRFFSFETKLVNHPQFF